MKIHKTMAAFALAGLAASVSLLEGGAAEPRLAKSVPLPGVSGRFDHAAIDYQTHHLFFAALGNDTLEVVDVQEGKRLHSIPGLKKPTGVAFLPKQNLIAVANGGDGTCRFFDAATYAERGRVDALEDADNLRYAATENRLYLGYGEGAIGIIDPDTMKLIGRFALPAHPESFQLEENGPRIFVNVPGAQAVVVLDRKKISVVATWKLDGLRANFPMALAEKEHRLFVACRAPARLVILDTESGKKLGQNEMSGDADDLFYDPEAHDIYASCGEGYIDTFHADPAAPLARTGRVPSRSGARTSFFDKTAPALYVAMPHQLLKDAEIAVFGLGTK